VNFLKQFLVATVLGGSSQGALVTFDLSSSAPGTGLTTHMVSVDGLTLTVTNPGGNIEFLDNSFGFILGGLFMDGGFAPNVDLLFSQSVRLVEFTLANNEFGASFSLTQGELSSVGQSTHFTGTQSFANTVDVFLAHQSIALVSAQHDVDGYSISSISVDSVPEPSSVLLLSAAVGGALMGRRRC
jgi:hypothetical protein